MDTAVYVVCAGVFIAVVAVLAMKYKVNSHVRREQKLRRAKLQRELENIKKDIG